MKVLVIGQGGREHALAWKLAQGAGVEAVFAAPGNYGTGLIGTNVDLRVDDAEALAAWAAREGIGLTVVGPEAALAAGVVDAFRARGLRIFGPTRDAARLETSKAWAKAFMGRHGIPTSPYSEFGDAQAAAEYLRGQVRYPLVIKADGLAAGKGVRIACDQAEALTAVDEALALGSGRVVIEAFLEGFEVSFLAISDGSTVRPLACAHDYKHAQDGGRGPMTGGMGAYSPVGLEDTLTETVMESIVEPAVRGMAQEGIAYQGVLYAGLMLTADGPRVLEFNARFGDPETQVLLPRWQADLAAVLAATADGRLEDLPPFSWSAHAACGVVLAAAGYPESIRTGHPIAGLDTVDAGVLVFHGGSRPDAPSQGAVTAGGRVLTVVGHGDDLAAARDAAYRGAARIAFEGCWYRRDIGADAATAAVLAG